MSNCGIGLEGQLRPVASFEKTAYIMVY